jgi:hypothetical protein
MTMRCSKCGTHLGPITGGIPVTTNSRVRYEFGHTTVRWTQGGPEEHNPICDDCDEACLSPEDKALRDRCERDFRAAAEKQVADHA